jgi:DNA-binding CsgD family transcriptional regulator
MVSDSAGGLKRTSCAIVVIGQDPRLSKRIAAGLRVAGFRIATSASDADLASLRAVACEHQSVAVFEVNSSFEEVSCHLRHFRALLPTGRFSDGEVIKKEKNRCLRSKKGRRSPCVGKGGTSGNAASSRAVTPAAAIRERGPTDRQAMILKSLVNGDSNKTVARKLHIAEETVKVHMKRLLRRIGVKNRTQAAIWALNNDFAPAASETGEPWRARSVTEQRIARRCAASNTESGVPLGTELTRSRGGESKGTGKAAWKGNVAKYH